MKTNSLVNMILSGTQGQPVPVVGMGITILMWTDRHAGTITRVSPSGKTFWYQRDVVKRLDTNGLSEVQQYTFTSDLDAPLCRARISRRGVWLDRGKQIRVGDRNEYRDFSF